MTAMKTDALKARRKKPKNHSHAKTTWKSKVNAMFMKGEGAE
jgi:hypothetical protein